MDSGAASFPRRRTRQQWDRYFVEVIEKKKRLSQSGNPPQSSSTCSVNIGDDVTASGDIRESSSATGKLTKAYTTCGVDYRKIGKWSEDESMVRSLDKGKKRMDNGNRMLSPGTCESMTKRTFVQVISDDEEDSEEEEEEEEDSDPDVVVTGESAAASALNTGSGSGSWSNCVGLKSPIVTTADEVVSSTSSMCRTRGPSELHKSEEPTDFEESEDDCVKSQESSDDTTESSESESEASSDEDNDDPEDKDYRVNEPSSSSESDDEDDRVSCHIEPQDNEEGKGSDIRIGLDDDDDGRKESEDDDPVEKQENGEGKGESNEGLLPGLVFEGEKHRGRAYLLRPRSLSKSKKRKLNHGNCSSPILLSDDEESESPFEEGTKVDDSTRYAAQKDKVDNLVKKVAEKEKADESVKNAAQKDRKTRKKCVLKDLDFVKFVVDSIRNVDDHDKLTSPEEKEQFPVKETLPLIFRFEDEDPLPPEKEEWEKEIENLFAEMDMGILESCIGFTNPSLVDKVSGCQMGNHHLILDEQIGLICKVCSHVHLESKYIYPAFAERNRGRHERKYFGESSPFLDVDGFRFDYPAAVHDSAIYMEGTVWDLVPLHAKATMYPHQREGFEFMWKNIAGDIYLEKLSEPLSASRGGCIISHPPGTGKTRLTIVFLQAFLKQFPKCRPVIIAPPKLLSNWEAEFQKWEADIPFHNLNNNDFSCQEDEVTVGLYHCLSHAGRKNKHPIRMVKLKSWAKSKSVLGISYDLFEKLTGENGDGYSKEIREILLTLPGLVVLEEGHTPRNEQSLLYKAMTKVETQRRILLSGTVFQNNFKELYNTLRVVCPKFAAESEQKWASLSNSIDTNTRALEELRDMIAPLIHICSENVKMKSLPGIRDTLVYLKPTDLQKKLLNMIPEYPGSFDFRNMVSLISVHPSLVANKKVFSDLESQLNERECRLDPNTGVKTKFVVELIRLCDGMRERVIVFSQLLDPLRLIKEQLNSLFHWTLGREILYMDGELDVKQRQKSISSLNDPKSDAKVLLASITACSEGINLIGASRVVFLDVHWNPSVEQQAVSRAYRNGQTKFVHVYCPVASKWEVNKIEQQTRKKYHSGVLLSRNEVNTCKTNPSCSVLEDNILESMVQHESLRHIFEELPHEPRAYGFNSCNQPPKASI
ncbi:PREDICTED: SNF2 domain-containing protein CLASSY 4 [Nicotiana attenuata]|uniref:Snf2 domain-containing protein classy 3 n=1 Tax=Nicotiana attenuata TaxID=49451 RepID=A0A1J6ILP6_NICAT|nr:PREDICTED: SNF2 domain-containing protein CLASSY 4 [Nicotiana attenuata]XP_019252553.1 PREDICTED: SNF2 domain-containing protein CLASSY 4 [Nicotiana attenuata]XP_019252554.1 PREDICTED: SNF2 domain-containing protein CLASSY 4 [Nicotiana attenuata]XP_019252555.1 PREDICTED: SNF2 domain-containing protein CLASSY 4 [Nicotiana attenuata]OIS99802.1 snf2 domain-containing protein classy 3 [Nicotiana attenuata]